MRFLLLFSVLIVTIPSYSQNHFKNGKTVEFRFNQSSTSGIDRIYFCNDTLCEGLLEQLDSNNQILSQAQFSNGKQNGIFRRYHSNGNIAVIGNMVENCRQGLVVTYYPSGKIKSTEYFPPNTCGIIEGTEMVSFYENSKIETWYVYKEGWELQFHYYFSSEGDTLGYMLPLKKDPTIFEEVNFESGEQVSRKLFRISEYGERVYFKE